MGGVCEEVKGAKFLRRQEKVKFSTDGEVYLWKRRTLIFFFFFFKATGIREHYSIEIMLFRAGKVHDWVP